MANQSIMFFMKSYIDISNGYLTNFNFNGSDYISSSLTNMVDRDANNYAATSGFAFLPATLYIDMLFPRQIDTIFLGSNFSSFTVQYWNGSSYTDFNPIISYTNNTSSFLLINLPSIMSIQKLKITCSTTQTTNDEKRITSLSITQSLGNLMPAEITPLFHYERVVTTSITGGSIQLVKFPSYKKFQANLTFNNLYGGNYTTYQAIKQNAIIGSFLIYIYYDDIITPLSSNGLYLVNDEADFDFKPNQPVIPAGVDGTMSLREV